MVTSACTIKLYYPSRYSAHGQGVRGNGIINSAADLTTSAVIRYVNLLSSSSHRNLDNVL